MTLTIELTLAEQERITAAALQKGLDPAEFIKMLVTEHLPKATSDEQQYQAVAGQKVPDRSHFYFTATREQFHGALEEIAQMNKNLPGLNDDAFDRENLYEDRL